MGDRFNPIKFGPEWLRKLSREPSTTAGNGSGRESADPTPGAALPVSPGAAPPGMSLQPQRPNSNPNASANSNTSKVHLAKLRYGREEMLALYDKNTVEAPSQLKTVEALYWQKPKPPYALNIFEDKMRDIRGQHTLGGDRFGVARGRGVSADNRVRIPSVSEARGRSRLYNRPTPSVARGGGWHGMPTKNPHMTDEDASLKSWTNNNSLSGLRPNAEQVDWANKPAYRTKRPTNTNWRQTSREEGEEWRSSDTRRPEKWDREWPERSSQEKTWHVNRRTWVGGETADDSLPEWAVENSEACAGTFDSSGAFHGYSNDDTNLPKSTAEPYVLARSQTHGNFTRSKTVDEGSDEWWASEKAKKLSPKRFDASEIKFKKPSSSDESEPKPEKNSGGRLSYSTTSGASGGAPNEMTNSPLNAQISTPAKDVNEPTTAKLEPNKANTFSKNAEEWQSQSKPFDPQTAETPTDDQGNFQSVMMPTKNMLRQKHQNIGTPTDSPVKQQSHNMRYFMDSFTAKQPEPNEDKEKDKIVDEMLQLNLDADNMPLNQLLGNRPNPGMSAPLSMPAPAIPQNQGSQMNPTPHSQYTPVQGAAAANKSFGGMNVTNTAIPPQSVPAQPPTAINVQNKVGSLQPANAQNTQAGLASGLQPGGGLAGHLTSSAARGLPFQSGGALPNVANNNSLFMGQRPTGPIPNPGDMVNQVLPPHIQRSSPAYDNPFYSNMMQQMPQPMPSVGPNLSELWYYEDPNNTIQGPFTTSEMLHWYRAGFFHHTLMIRRANEVHMSPLGTYGPHPFGSVFGSLWSPPSSNLQELLWIHNRQAVENSLPPNPNIGPNYFPDYLPPQLPMVSHEDITKDMRTEDDILAQIRANQPPRPASSISTLFHDEEPVPVLEDFTANADLNMQELQKLIQRDDGDVSAPPLSETEPMQDRPDEIDENGGDILKTSQSKPAESKLGKFAKVEDKSKDQAAKPKPKKIKDEKKEDSADGKPKDCESKSEKRSNESSPSAKSKKDDKVKKELEKEKKEWLKEGFTIVKSAEKNKDKKKSDEVKAAEEAERKRKEEEKAEQDLRKRQIETLKKQQEIQNQQQQQAARQAELMSRKAPWSAPNQTIASSYPGPTLAEIQRLEREKKLEQMKQQQQMMQIIAQQQQAALAREQAFGGQELQGGVGWLKNQASNTTTQNQSLAEIQAEARKACVAAAAAAAAAREEAPPKPTATPINIVPWGNTAHNGAGAAAPVGGFWDTAPEQPKVAKAVEPKPVEVKPKKKVVVVPPPKNPHKKDASPSADFDTWCTNALGIWRDSNIDVPTFISFLRDIESPYEVKDYVKCYLGDTKDSNDFARQFLERRSRLLRVGMVTPSDDLCSPAIAINPRTISGSGSYDYTNVKGKPKKIKKNKMLKVDARNILGFSVTASEDRINVGDIDTV